MSARVYNLHTTQQKIENIMNIYAAAAEKKPVKSPPEPPSLVSSPNIQLKKLPLSKVSEVTPWLPPNIFGNNLKCSASHFGKQVKDIFCPTSQHEWDAEGRAKSAGFNTLSGRQFSRLLLQTESRVVTQFYI